MSIDEILIFSTRSVRTIKQYKWNYSCLLEIIPRLKNLINDPSKTPELRNVARKVSMTFTCVLPISDCAFRWISSWLQHIPTILLGCVNTSHFIWPRIRLSWHHHQWTAGRVKWAWTTPFFRVCSAPLKPLGNMIAIPPCMGYISLHFFLPIFYRVREQLWDGSIRMDAGMLPMFLWVGDPLGWDFNKDNMVNGLFKGYLLLCVRYRSFTSIRLWLLSPPNF